MDQVDEIKQKLDIIQVVGEYVQLKKAGVNWKGRCPFHNEKTPSFMVNPDKGIYHCFGCNEGGDIYSFVQKIEGIDFPEALRLLAGKAGVQLEQYDPRISSQKNRLLDICSAATNHWHEILYLAQGKKALEYLQKRGLSELTIKSFKFGYALESWDDLLKYLKSKDFTEAEIFLAGLTVEKSGGRGYYDRFRDRVTFPVFDIHSNVIGFSARTLNKDEAAKYINSPENPIYHKGRTLYGLDKAKQAIRDNGYAIIVEGNMDVVACHQAGFKNVIACSGTALTVEQIKILKRYTENIALCFDQDEAGQRAAQRSVDLLWDAEMNIKIVQLAYGKDPDECIKHDIKLWEQSLRSAKLVMQFYIDKYLTEEALSNINTKKPATKIVLQELAKIKNKIEQAHWLKELANKLDLSEAILRESIPNPSMTSLNPQKTFVVEPKVEKTQDMKYLEKVFTILINHPQLISYAEEFLPIDYIQSTEMATFYKNLLIHYNEASCELTRKQLVEWLANNHDLPTSYLDSLIIYIDEVYEGFRIDDINNELIGLIKTLTKHHLEATIKMLTKELEAAEKRNDKEQIQMLMREMQTKSEELSKLK
ncbi:MAG: primase protein [Parcubacteria group bacterium GW2011_GWC2_39_14]|nr:MAG: primase protein [Parcubacteria group bacterium GW2011_GWC2_39_14]KKR54851.1 MAG: primase protein [Parcubacteria group bacterium GW2011_GWA2_40_23]